MMPSSGNVLYTVGRLGGSLEALGNLVLEVLAEDLAVELLGSGNETLWEVPY